MGVDGLVYARFLLQITFVCHDAGGGGNAARDGGTGDAVAS